MPEFASAMELLAPGESALVIFTRGRWLTDNHNGTASTGWWKIDPQHLVDRVIICLRASKDPTDNELFVGKYDGVEGPSDEGPSSNRYLVRVIDFQRIGETRANWREFANTYMRPTRYIKKPVS